MSKSKGNLIAPDAVLRHGRGRRPAPVPPVRRAARRRHRLDRPDRPDHRRLRPLPRPGVAALTEHDDGRPAPAEPTPERRGRPPGHPPDRRQGQRRHRRWSYNTAVAACMEFVNLLQRYLRTAAGPHERRVGRGRRRPAALLAPMTPHVTAELWERRHGAGPSVHAQPWPSFDPELVRAETVTMVVQVNGKVRDRIEVDPDISEDEARDLALASARVVEALAGGSRRGSWSARPAGQRGRLTPAPAGRRRGGLSDGSRPASRATGRRRPGPGGVEADPVDHVAVAGQDQRRRSPRAAPTTAKASTMSSVDEVGHLVPLASLGQPVELGVQVAPAVQGEHRPVGRGRPVEGESGP